MTFATDGTISSWPDLVAKQIKYDNRREWIFRGQSKDLDLKTTLDRVCESFDVPGPAIIKLEKQIIREFQRQYPNHDPGSCPPDDDTQQWLSLMRHYGAPTRLLDFTYSLFIAAYFALENAERESVVWAIKTRWIAMHELRVIRGIGGNDLYNAWAARKGGAFERIFFDLNPAGRFVCSANPYRLHERLALQQALSLCPGDVTTDFQNNPCAMDGHDRRENVVKISISGGTHRTNILSKLYRAGVNRAVLFPGLQGFAESLRTKAPIFLRIQEVENPAGRSRPTK